jgi:UDP-4-amino-4,6-dideoxy-N-acetyl-beta-L-altrosamine N-acetyltransferase
MPKREDFKLRKIESRDKDMILLWRNAESVRKNMYTEHVISQQEHDNWFASIKENSSAEYFIFESRGVPAGVVNVTQIDRNNGKCYWGFYSDPEAPPGTGSTMEFLALEYIFNELGIRKLCCEVFAFNKPVIKLHKKFGFEQEGYFKQHIRKGDGYEDVESLALFGSDWSELAPRLEKIVFR